MLFFIMEFSFDKCLEMARMTKDVYCHHDSQMPLASIDIDLCFFIPSLVTPTTVTTPSNLIKDYKYFDQLIDITLNIFYFNFFVIISNTLKFVTSYVISKCPKCLKLLQRVNPYLTFTCR